MARRTEIHLRPQNESAPTNRVPVHLKAGVAAIIVIAMVIVGLEPAAGTGTASISGSVFDDETGAPLADVCVVVNEDPSSEVRTGADGRYRFDGLDAGGYGVVFNWCEVPLPGYAAERYAGGEAVDLADGQQVGGVDAGLGPAAMVAGTVTDEGDGRPLEGVRVYVEAAGGYPGFSAFTRTDARGRYEVANLPNDDYLLEFAGDGTGFHLPEYHDDVGLSYETGDYAGTPSVVRALADRLTTVDAVLEPGGVISGRLWAAHLGTPIFPWGLELWPSGDGTSPVAPLGFAPFSGLDVEEWLASDGHYRTRPIPAGEYRLRFRGDSASYEDRWWPDATSYEDAGEVAVIPRVLTDGIDVTVRPVHRERECFLSPWEAPAEFVDVLPGVHEPAIRCLSARSVFLDGGLVPILAGIDETHFAPSRPARRDQVASVLARALHSMDVALPEDAPDAFTDDAGNVHEANIDRLAALGVIWGDGAGRFHPAEPVTRGQMATLLVRAWEAAGLPPLLSLGDAFADDEADAHEMAIDQAAAAALVTGAAEDAYEPGGDLRRDQLASLVWRLELRVFADRFMLMLDG